jgi:hypothetical protein
LKNIDKIKCRFHIEHRPIWDGELKKSSMAKATSKQERFRALAEKRTNKALDAILRIGNLSNRQIYEYDESEVRKIAKALRDAINTIEGRFESSKGRAGGGFKL